MTVSHLNKPENKEESFPLDNSDLLSHPMNIEVTLKLTHFENLPVHNLEALLILLKINPSRLLNSSRSAPLQV